MLETLIDWIIKWSGVFVLGGSVLGFLFHKTLFEWFKSRFARAVGQDLADHGHRLSRELEVYRTSLLRELEEFKLGIDIRRSIALRMAEHRLTALTTLASDLSEFVNEATTMMQMDAEQRASNFDTFNQCTDRVRKSARTANIFLPHTTNLALAAVLAHCLTDLRTLMQANQSLPHDHQTVIASRQAYIPVATDLRAAIYAPPPEGAP